MNSQTQAAGGLHNLYRWYVALVLCAASTMSFMDRWVLVLVNEPLRTNLGITDTQLGLLHGLGFVVLYSTCAIPLGWVADISNRRNLIIGGMLVWGGATVASGFASSFEALLAARVLVGMGEACLVPAAMSLLAAYFDRQQLARATAVFGSGAYIGQGLAFLGGGILLSALNAKGGLTLGSVEFAPWQVVFLAAGAMVAPVLVLLTTVREPVRAKGRQSLAANLQAFRDSLAYVLAHWPRYGSHFVAASATAVMGYGFLSWSVSSLARIHHMAPAQAGMLMGVVAAVTGVCGNLLGGLIMDALVKRDVKGAHMLVMALAALIALPSTVVFCFFANGNFAIYAAALAGVALSTSLALPPIYAGIQMFTPDAYRGMVASLNVMISTLIGFLVGPPAVGRISDLGGGGGDALALGLVTVAACASAVIVAVALTSRKLFGAGPDL